MSLRGPRGAAVIWVGRDGRVRRVGADVLKEPVAFGGKRRGTCSLQRISNQQEKDWQERPAQRAAHRKDPSDRDLPRGVVALPYHGSVFTRSAKRLIFLWQFVQRESVAGPWEISCSVVSLVTRPAAAGGLLFRKWEASCGRRPVVAQRYATSPVVAEPGLGD